MSKRIEDINGWYEVKDNPLSKSGVYQYSGSMIDPSGEFGLDPDEIYSVLRPVEELADPECIESFKMVPWVDEHTMLGDGFTPAEKKGIQGVIGSDVYFDKKDGTLKGNVKVFTENLKRTIDNGKKELSLGYRCKYIKESGNSDGEKYEFVQKMIRGNHLASVEQGRMGSEVAVLDGDLLTITLDYRELQMTPEEMEKALSELMGTVKTLMERVEQCEKATGPAADEEEEKAEDVEEEKEGEDAECEDEECEDGEEAEGMDSLKADNTKLKSELKALASTVDALEKDGMKTLMSEISKRDTLANSLSRFVGSFDHAEMTLNEVAVYGAEKLGLDCKGSEIATVGGYLHGRTPSIATVDNKGQAGMTELDDYLGGK